MNYNEAFEVLGLKVGASKEEAKSAFKKLAKEWHPDICKKENADAEFKKINEAYQTIEAGPPKENQFQDFNPFQGGFGFGFDINDFFGQNNRRVRKADDINLPLNLSFKESVLGCQKTIEYHKYHECDVCSGNGKIKIDNGCKKCNGQGVITSVNGNMITRMNCPDCRGKTNTKTCDNCNGDGGKIRQISLNINVPPGVINGNILRLGGAGNWNGINYSNVNLKLSIDEINGLTIENSDVLYYLNISFLNSLKGTKVSVPTIYGDKEIEVPKLSKNKEEIIIPNLGVGGIGSQKVILNVENPINPEQLIEFLEKNANSV